MTALPLPQEFEAWARNEVEAGRAGDVAEVARTALDDYRRRRDQAQLEAFRRSLDEASADAAAGNGLTAEEVFGPILARLEAKV